MKKKNILVTTVILLTFTGNAFTQAASREKPIRQAQDRPNIVFLMTDDQRWDTLGCYGRPEFQTTNIDQLAEQGVIFDNAYQAVAICAPSRATIMTGRYFANHKAGFTYPFDVKLTPEDFDDTYPARLKQAGYRTGFVGKFNIYTQGVKPEDYFDYYAVGGKMLPKDDAALRHIFRGDRDPKERTIKKGDALIHFLDTQPKGQPFCISVSFDAVKNDKDKDMYGPHTEIFKDQVFSVPANWVEGENASLPDVVKNNARGYWLHKARTSTPELYQTLARRFATQGYTVDQEVGRLMEKLKEMGVLDNTIVIYTSDNGRFHGSQGLFDKCILYEEAVKQPLIIFDGRVPKEKRGRREAAMISSTDMAPTILSLANVEVPQRMQGRELTSILNQTQDMSVWRDAVFMENLFLQDMFSARNKKVENLDEVNQQLIAENKSYRSRGVRTERFKYFIYNEHDPVIEELYDLENDPYEQNDLVSNPEYAEILSKLRKQTEDFHAGAVANQQL
ncbi:MULTISPECIES: sulfatase-like hydrolase/transferase [unclassified Lentimonas]|uniref:sulfatase-like hydrolase/transferase n=1 Tax=unclassified Lentimonas TaxID=2630993 RepID=UPI00132A76BA|nr:MULTISPECIES: sulfatase-like hydrolase/transferase [unclassified Lentimonas]CAA6677727.1 Choline-sulfatase (EC [Lentimonas sp. CC4]CAA6684990.1 Choline-sulfatase (EC [Lentimonas sp. CC6]CAA7077894.1 Choline-sulfatase (EC [Lentimonas sp. CC4]CAA7169819.1 Choline-sulfatase (EC [Lentimonas sp. CC21]CAA7179938.1 Choline-sulfatase (EC [Lentimonas sp. CC8]